MSFKDKLRKAQGNRIVILDLSLRLRLKTIDGKACFVFYDSMEEVEKHTSRPIEGILVGSSMILSAFSPDLGRSGGRYFSRPYWSLDNISLYEPSKGRSKHILTGDMEEVIGFLNRHARGNIQKKKVFYLATKAGLVSVETNISISIDQLQRFPRNTFEDNKMILTPVQYTLGDENISASCRDNILGKLALENPPTYANITMGGPITDDDIQNLNAEELLDNFLQWRDYLTKAQRPDVDGDSDSGDSDSGDSNDHPTPTEVKEKSVKEGDKLVDEEDDLPF